MRIDSTRLQAGVSLYEEEREYMLFLAYRFWCRATCHKPFRSDERASHAANECIRESQRLADVKKSSDVVNGDRCRRDLAWSWGGFTAHQSFAIFWTAGAGVPRTDRRSAPVSRAVVSFRANFPSAHRRCRLRRVSRMLVRSKAGHSLDTLLWLPIRRFARAKYPPRN